MNNRRRIIQLMLIMMAITTSVVVITISILYNTAFQQESARLVETAQSQARLLEAVAQFDSQYSTQVVPGGAFAATISQMRSAHEHFEGFGETGEFTLAKREGDQITFLLSHRHHDLRQPHPVPWHSTEAEPMRKALMGKSGTMIGYDYRGIRVLAAYEPVKILNLGIVAKIDLAEIRSPFIMAGLASSGAALVLIILGTFLFLRISNPMIRVIEENEQKYRTLFESSSEGIFLLGDVFVDCNQQACKLWACTKEDILGHKPLDFSPLLQPDGRYSEEAALERFTAAYSGEPQYFYWQHQRKDGVLIDTQLSLKAVVVAGQSLLLASIQDITDRMRAEKNLRESSHQLSERVKELNCLYDISRLVETPNITLDEIYMGVVEIIPPSWQYPEITCARLTIDDLTFTTDNWELSQWRQESQIVLNSQARGTLEVGYLEKKSDADEGPFLVEERALLDAIVGRIGHIMERYEIKQSLQESEQRYRQIVEEAIDTVYITDPEGFFTYINPTSFDLTGYLEEELIGMHFVKLVAPTMRDAVLSYYKEIRDRGLPSRKMEFPIITRDGTEKWIEQEVTLLKQDDDIIGVQGIVRDISDRKRAEEILRQSEARFRSVFQSAHDAIITADSRGAITTLNNSLLELFGYEEGELIGQSLTMLMSEEFRQKHDQAFSAVAGGNQPNIIGQTVELQGLKKDGTKFPIELSLSTWETEEGKFFTGIIRDIAERRLFEQQLNQAEKLVAIGQLAAGIAHEINTPIQYVGDNLRFIDDAFKETKDLLKIFPQLITALDASGSHSELAAELKAMSEGVDMEYLSEEIPQAIKESLEGTERVTTIVRAMKEFSHPQGQEKSPQDLNRSLQNTITVARNEWKYVADLETDFDPNLPPVPVLINEFNQVILNVLVNAAHAIAEKSGDESTQKGLIKVSSRQIDGYAEIRIEDSGTGVPEEIRSRIFNPFFTTKPVGAGTGQGLALAHAIIVKKHGGSITFETEQGQGATFIIKLPLQPQGDTD